MFKIKSLYLSAALVLMVILASFDVIFMKGTAGYNLIILYLIILSLSVYVMRDIKVDKNNLYFLIFSFICIILVSAGQYIFSFHFNPSIWIGTLYMVLAVITAFISGRYLKASSDKPELKMEIRELWVLGAILILAVVLRIYNLDTLPPGIWFDEAQNGNEIIRIINGKPLEIFVARLTMMPAMFFYIGAVFVKLFGVDISSIRYVSVFTGTLSILAFYFLCRQIFKNGTLALLGAFLLATSRWHITFSRVAFLGMLTLLLVILCFYFYLKALEKKGLVFPVLSGLSMGFALYTFSGANFIPIIVIAHLLFSLLNFKKDKIKRVIFTGFITLGVAGIVALPLFSYALKNPEIFSKRFKDLTIANDIEKEKSIMPLLKSIQIHSLMFNYEGDYNGRHNLYKKPMLDNITGVLFAAGLFIAITSPGYGFYILWFLIMLCAGIFTISIEAPQAYRIIGIVPVVYIFVLLAIKRLQQALLIIEKSSFKFISFVLVLSAAIAGLNIYQYFVLYPSEKATYMSFSPEANAIAEFIKNNSNEYLLYVTTAKNMYGFYPWEQKLICDFVNYGKTNYEYLRSSNKIDEKLLSEKNGVIVLLRSDDNEDIKTIEKEYPKVGKKEFLNRATDEIMFICYYIKSADIKVKQNSSVNMLLYR